MLMVSPTAPPLPLFIKMRDIGMLDSQSTGT